MKRPSWRAVPIGGDRTSWIGLALGVPIMGFAVRGVLGADEVHLSSWGRWIVTSALVHDLVLVPIVLLVGSGLRRVVPASAWVPLRWVLLTVGSLVLIGFPFVRRYGYRDDNPSALSRDYGTGLARFCAVVAIVGVGWWLLRLRRDRGLPSAPCAAPPPSPLPPPSH